MLDGSMSNTADVLLLVRGRILSSLTSSAKNEDFNVFADMRLPGLGMVRCITQMVFKMLSSDFPIVSIFILSQIVNAIIFVKQGVITNITIWVSPSRSLKEWKMRCTYAR